MYVKPRQVQSSGPSGRHGYRCLTEAEVRALLGQMEGRHALMAGILYGAGLRLMECVRLRVKDMDFGYSQITVRDGKGEKDRVTILPAALHVTLRTHLEGAQALHQKDPKEGYGAPYALARKYPRAGSGRGSMSFQPPSAPSIRARASNGAITSTSRRCSGRSRWRFGKPGSPSPRAVTRCAIASRHTFCNRATTSGRCRSSSATRTCRPR